MENFTSHSACKISLTIVRKHRETGSRSTYGFWPAPALSYAPFLVLCVAITGATSAIFIGFTSLRNPAQRKFYVKFYKLLYCRKYSDYR